MGIAQKSLICAAALALSACASAKPSSFAQAAPQNGLDCVTRAAAARGYQASKSSDSDVLILSRKRPVFAGKEALTRVLSFGFVSAEQGREDRLMVSRGGDMLRVDAVGVVSSGSDVTATAAGRKDATDVLDQCAL